MPVFQRVQQRVMRGGNERHGDFLADQVGRLGDAAAVSYHPFFIRADQLRNIENLDPVTPS